MATRIRNGLYEINHPIGIDGLGYGIWVQFLIECNQGELNTEKNNWVVFHQIGSEIERWDTEFATKKAAVAAIEEHLINGKYQKLPGLGWCYIPS